MKRVTWEDQHGYKHVSMVRDSDGVEAGPKGIPVGPPDLELVDWEEVKRNLNNLLVEMDILTYRDIQRQNSGVSTAVRSVLTSQIVNIFKWMEGDHDE
jgi:hypothetical protein